MNYREWLKARGVEVRKTYKCEGTQQGYAEEMKKPKPRDSLLLPLMNKTFQDRCIFIQNDASAVLDILEHYPALGRPVVVSVFSFHVVDGYCFL